MGGVGSTRWKGYVKKQVVEDCYVIAVAGPGPEPALGAPVPEGTHWHGRTAAEDLALTWAVVRGPADPEGTVTLSGPEIESVTVSIMATRPHKRGLHWYWLCSRCGRRVAKLYLPPESRAFRCRHCHDLTYRSCQRHDRLLDRLAQMGPDALEEAAQSDNPRVKIRAEWLLASRRIIVLPTGERIFWWASLWHAPRYVER